MKKRSKLFKLLSVLVSVVMMFAGARSDAYAAWSTQTSTKTCGLGICFKKLNVSGPYGGLNETVDSSIPYVGGRTYSDLYSNEYGGSSDYIGRYHLMVIYCPKYNKSDSDYLKHTMTLVFPVHGNTFTGYSQLNANYHYANYVCDHGQKEGTGSDSYVLTQHLCGENGMISVDDINQLMSTYDKGCGQTTAVKEAHSWSYGSWCCDNNSESLHERIRTCTKCGYQAKDIAGHSLSTSWSYLDTSQHKKITKCSVCSYSNSQLENHTITCSDYVSSSTTQHTFNKTCMVCGIVMPASENHSLVYGSWNKTSTVHSRSVNCSLCDFSTTESGNHSWTINNYSSVGATQHTYIKTCSVCGYSETVTENHKLTYGDWSVYDDEQHRRTVSCSKCSYSRTEYDNHNDDNSDGACDDCDYAMTIFSVTVPTSMTVSVDKNGNTYSATNIHIVNNSTDEVEVKSISLSGKSGWTVVPYSTNMANQKVDSKKIGLKICDSVSTDTATMTMLGDWKIPRGSSLPLTYSAVVSATTTPVTDQNVTDVVFVIDWSDV